MVAKCGRNNHRHWQSYFRFLPLIPILSAILAFLWIGRRKPRTRQAQPILLDEVNPYVSPATMDDLTLIEGIGPKVAAVLHANGITQFQQLARFPAAELKQILIAAGNRLSDPSTWPEQAALAARGDWDGLKALQASLFRGRRMT